jgi:hypothetical protein
LRAGADGRLQWRRQPSNRALAVRAVVLGGPDSIWLLGEVRRSADTVERILAERWVWR